MIRQGRHTNVGRDCLFYTGSYIRSRFLFGMLFTWNWDDMSLFECKRSGSVLYYVIHQRHYIFYSTKCATVNTLPFNWYLEVSVLGKGICLNCLVLLASNKYNNYAANTSSNGVVVTRNNTQHISNSHNTAKSHGRESYDMCPKNFFLG